MKKTKAPAPAPIRWPQHKSGKQCGYNEYEDGSIEIAPQYADMFLQFESEERALRLLIAALNDHLAKCYKKVGDGQTRFWDRIKDDYSLDFDKYDWSYRAHDRRVLRKEKKTEEKR
jgi:hypothetical protein